MKLKLSYILHFGKTLHTTSATSLFQKIRNFFNKLEKIKLRVCHCFQKFAGLESLEMLRIYAIWYKNY